MRTASIAALVVVGGTLAALPFRLSPKPSPNQESATGPRWSPLDETTSDVTLASQIPRRSSDPNPADDAGNGRSEVKTVARRRSSVPAPDWQRDPRRNARDVDLPLTFDDLMIPIETPKPIAERFTATVQDPPHRRMTRRSPDASPRPSLHDGPSKASLAIDPSLGNVASSRLHRSSAKSVLKSESIMSMETLPVTTEPTDRPRHWITQP